MWDVDFSLIEDWLDRQDDETVAAVFAALELLRDQGPALRRPLVGTLKGTKVKNLKELRPASPRRTEVRIVFAFDPLRQAVMLLAGNKAPGPQNKLAWGRWYRMAIPEAERLYEEHLRELEG